MFTTLIYHIEMNKCVKWGKAFTSKTYFVNVFEFTLNENCEASFAKAWNILKFSPQETTTEVISTEWYKLRENVTLTSLEITKTNYE